MAFSPLADLPFLLSDFGVPVVAGSVQTVGILDLTTASETFGSETAQVVLQVPSVLVRTGSLPAVKTGSAITVNGVAYTVRDRQAESDGALERLFLKRVTP
jgi:hypothetical protein